MTNQFCVPFTLCTQKDSPVLTG